MTDGRYDSRRGQYQPRGRDEDRTDRSSRDERGFLDRARDEVSSWFGDDDAERRRERDDRAIEHGGERGRAAMSDHSGYDRLERSPRYRDEGYRRPYTGRSTGGGLGGDFDRPGPEHRWDRGETQRGFEAGSRHDPDYSQWRSRQIDELDRDYEEFRRENQSRFDSEFSTWRGQRQAKRQMLGNVTEHMEVVGSDDQPVGKVDWVKNDRIILTRNDSPDGRHQVIPCSMVDKVEDGKVILSRTAEEAKRELGRPDRDRALFERENQGEDGPHMLGRSFSGTY